eukprot:4148128-Pyramimonas_sp.AAC.1
MSNAVICHLIQSGTIGAMHAPALFSSAKARRADKVVKVAVRVAAVRARVVPQEQADLAAVIKEVVERRVWGKSRGHLARHALFASLGHDRALTKLRVLAKPQ